MAPDAGTIPPEAEATRAAVTALSDTLRTDIHRVLDDLKTAADQLLDRGIAAQLTWAQETMERLAPLLDERLAQGRASAGAAFEQAKRAVPHVAAAQQHPWLLLGGALLISYLVAGGDSRTPTPPPSQP
jgi:glutathione S-transferase